MILGGGGGAGGVACHMKAQQNVEHFTKKIQKPEKENKNMEYQRRTFPRPFNEPAKCPHLEFSIFFSGDGGLLGSANQVVAQFTNPTTDK